MFKDINTENETGSLNKVKKTNLIDKYTQTEPISIYDSRFSLGKLKSLQKKKIFIKNSEILYDVEDTIIDRILKKGEINKGKRCLNVYLGPFCFKDKLLFIADKELVMNFSHNINTIRDYFKTSILKDQIEVYMDSLSSIVKLKDKYFNIFKKFIYQGKLSLIQVFTVFTYWLSNFLHAKIFSYYFDVILLLYLSIYSKTLLNCIDTYFIINYLEESLYPDIGKVKEYLKNIKIKPMINIIDIEIIIEYLCLFFKGMSIGPQ